MKPPNRQPKDQAAKQARLAKALRENLRKRKQQAREQQPTAKLPEDKA